MNSLEIFTNAYLEAMKLSEVNEDIPKDVELTPSEMTKAKNDCRRFFNVYKDDLSNHFHDAGADFWYTRNVKTTGSLGFWTHPEKYGKKKSVWLTKACILLGHVDVTFGKTTYDELPLYSKYLIKDDNLIRIKTMECIFPLTKEAWIIFRYK